MIGQARYSGSDGEEGDLPPKEQLESWIRYLPKDYWEGEGATQGTACLSVIGSTGVSAHLLILPNLQLQKIVLKRILRSGGFHRTWVSVASRDPSMWDKHFECDDEWLASLNLFVDPEAAWYAVEDFIECADEWLASWNLFVDPEAAWRSVENLVRDKGFDGPIEWVAVEDLPENANW